jgi:hypothetical protein
MTSAFGLQLDCIDNGDGTYSCVELGKSTGLSPAQTEAAKIEPAYLERAKKACQYRAPSRRVSGMASASAVRMEAKKAAQTTYNQCLVRKARELQKAEQ